MRRSFYQYLMTLRGAKSNTAVTKFAEAAFHDQRFPKHSQDYQVVSDYLELSTDYLPNMDIFDQLWESYLENSH